MGQHRRGPTLTAPILQPKPQIVILKAFRALDADRSGTIDYTEFSSVLKPWFDMTEVAAFSPVVHPPWVRSLLSPGKSAGLNPGMPVCLRRRTTAWIFSPSLTRMKAAKSHTTNSQRWAFQRGAESVGLRWAPLSVSCFLMCCSACRVEPWDMCVYMSCDTAPCLRGPARHCRGRHAA